MENEEFEDDEFTEKRAIIGLIDIYNHEMQALIGNKLQQLLVMLYNEGDEFSKRIIQKYCFKLLKRKNKLWEAYHGDFRKIYLLDYYSSL